MMTASYTVAPEVLKSCKKFPTAPNVYSFYTIQDTLDSLTFDDRAFIWRRLPLYLKSFWFGRWTP